MLACMALALVGCGGSDGANQTTVVATPNPVQARLDAAVTLVDQIPTPAGGMTVLRASDIAATAAGLETIVDSLIEL